ncbi:MAG: molybdenum cofactor guanylyltransferase [Gammaproteobacteria bacterium]|nr:molybdenum cofactor guanylyltransferase [Gammaproteobacteria bacterium]
MHAEVTGIILAGGRGQRMGGLDKGLVEYQGRPLVSHLIERLQPQVDRLIISANRNLECYRQFGLAVVSDMHQDFQGPLAGILAAGRECQSPWLLIAPCDLPQLPLDLSARLLAAVQQRPAQIALAHDGQRSQQLCLLLQRSLLDDLSLYLASGERRVISWIERHPWTQVDFADQPQAFHNLNYLQPN